MKTFGMWIALFIIVQAVLTAIQFFTTKQPVRWALRLVLIAAKALIAVAFALLVMAGPVFLRPVQPLLTMIYAVLLPDAAADLLTLLIWHGERSFRHLRRASLLLGAAFFLYGTVNMQIVTPEYHSFSSPKLTETHRIVFVSDLHVGSSQSFDTTRSTVEKIGAEHPDFVILGGDVTDDYTTKAEMEETYRLFGALGVPVYPDPQTLFAHEKADLAVISTPIFLHVEHASLAFENGCDVLLEKPIAATEEETQKIISARDKAGKGLAIGFQWCYDEAMRAFKADILAGRFGALREMKAMVLWPRDLAYYARGGGWAGKRCAADGRPLWDSVASNATAHYIMNMLWLAGAEPSAAAQL